jgi:CTP synthase
VRMPPMRKRSIAPSQNFFSSKQDLITTIRDILKLDAVPKARAVVERDHKTWMKSRELTSQQDHLYESVATVLVGKYTNLHDLYLSVIKSLEHSAVGCAKKLNLVWVGASNPGGQAKIDNPAEFHKAWHEVCTANGILVPG